MSTLMQQLTELQKHEAPLSEQVGTMNTPNSLCNGLCSSAWESFDLYCKTGLHPKTSGLLQAMLTSSNFKLCSSAMPASRCSVLWCQVAAVAARQARPADVRGELEEHQRQVARWEGRVARQLEKIVALQRSRGSVPRPSPVPAQAVSSESSSDQSPQQAGQNRA